MDVRDLTALVDRIHDLGSGDERAFSFAIADTARTYVFSHVSGLDYSRQPPPCSI
jgi:hypothetical protein